jgi:hypothetical protein
MFYAVRLSPFARFYSSINFTEITDHWGKIIKI